MGSGRHCVFDPLRQQPWEISAALVSIMAWPGKTEVEQLIAGFEALCARQVRASIEAYPEHADEWIRNYPHYARIGPREIKRRLRTFQRRLRHRMLAAKMARGFFSEAITGQPAPLPRGMKGLWITELAKLLLQESHLSDPLMVARRIWRETRPVIAIAAAFELCARLDGVKGDDFTFDYGDEDLLYDVIRLAITLEQVVLMDKRFGGKAQELVRLRLIEHRDAA
jgi:hypothetical protein